MLILTTSYSQKVLGSFSLPESEKFLDVKWDWSKAVIDKKLTEKELAIVGITGIYSKMIICKQL